MKQITRLLLVFVAALIPAGAHAQSSAPSGDMLNPGDQIRIVVWRNPTMSGDFQIAANGTIIHPLYRDVQVVGVPLSTVEDRLRTFLSKYETNPQFVIQPLVKVVVAGEVRNPNVLSVPPETTIGQALALAGGPSDRADLSNVRIIRDLQTVKIDLSGPDVDAASLQIHSGDQILIGRRRGSALNVIAPISSSIAAVAAIVALIIK
jgi:polysaccharide export outer membrane protein